MIGDSLRRAVRRASAVVRRFFPTHDALRTTHSKGFTLMEILVVLAIFATVSVTVTDIFLLSSRAERRASREEVLQREARTALEYIVRSVRGGSIAYDLMPSPIQSPANSLRVRTAGGTTLAFSLSSDTALCAESAAPCLLVEEDDDGAIRRAALTSSALAVEDFKFYVSPASDPFLLDAGEGAYDANQQPLVTIALSLIPVGLPAERISVQTTVATRQYVR